MEKAKDQHAASGNAAQDRQAAGVASASAGAIMVPEIMNAAQDQQDAGVASAPAGAITAPEMDWMSASSDSVSSNSELARLLKKPSPRRESDEDPDYVPEDEVWHSALVRWFNCLNTCCSLFIQSPYSISILIIVKKM